MLNYEQAAEQLGVSTRTVRRLVKSGELPAARIGAAVRIRPEVVRAFVVRSEQRMSDVSSSLVGSNDYQQGGPRDVPISAAFPGNAGARWQDWAPTDDMVGDEPVTSGVAGSGHVSGGIRVTEGVDAYPGFRPAGFGVGYGPDVPAWAQDSPNDGVDYDTPPDPALSSPSRPWSSAPRPSDTGFTQAFYPEQSGQTQLGAPDSTGTTGPRRLRRDDSAGGVLP